MVEISMLETLIMTYAPLLVTVIGIIVAFLKMIKIMRELKADNKLSNEEIVTAIKKSGGKLLNNIQIFDIYPNIEEGKKSMAYKLTFEDATKTLSDEEVMDVFNKVIKDIESKFNAKLRG